MDRPKAAEYFQQLARGESVSAGYPPEPEPAAYKALAAKVTSPTIRAALVAAARKHKEQRT